jgi:hypothetical protein
MTYTQQKIDAYAALEDAVEKLRAAYRVDELEEDPDDEPSILTGYVLVTSSIRFSGPSDDPRDDDLDTTGVGGMFSRRGQDPTMTYGIINDAVRHYNARNMQE